MDYKRTQIKELILIYIFKKPSIIFLIIISFIVTILGCSKATLGNPPDPNKILLHYINVGQADSILIQVNNKNLLIDAGNFEDRTKVVTYLQKHGVKKLQYIIATHPHEDHIGGMSLIIKKFDVGQLYAPKKTNNTKAFEGMVTALKSKHLKINKAKPGILLDLGANTSCEIIAPSTIKYDDINNYSIAIKLTYGSTSFLFMGDAQKISEKEIIESGTNISCDVLKIGHHGSSSSSSVEFLNLASPKMAIISCGRNNNYGHPHKQTLDNLKQKNVIIYRTDLNGTIVIQSDGTTIKKL